MSSADYLPGMLSVNYLWICLDFKIVGTQMTLHPKLIDRGTIVHSSFRLLSIITDSHTDVIVTATTPDVIRHLKPENKEISQNANAIIQMLQHSSR